MSSVSTTSYENDSNHIIIWLDLGIEDPARYRHLKAAFSTTVDPENEAPVKLVDKDFDEILRVAEPLTVNFEDTWFSLAAFTGVERCIECFERNQHKRIFFITSGSMGEAAVPIILQRFPHTFIDPVTSEPYMSIYVFCHNIQHQVDWALDYSDYIRIFDFEADLLPCIVRDIADYFVTQGKRLLYGDPPNNSAAYHQFSWANVLYARYVELEPASVKKEVAEINELLEHVEEELQSPSNEDE